MSCGASGSHGGFRCLRNASGGGYYAGSWQLGQQHGYGVKVSGRGRGLIYEGQWRHGQRHGYGTLRRQRPDGHAQRLYVGEWKGNARSGEGKQYYEDGSVYFGQWLENERHGRGIHWLPDGSIYVGEWQRDAMHGRGVLYAANGNRYVGEFESGCKSGMGVYYHEIEGQSVQQHGIWSDNVCKSSTLPLKKSSSSPRCERIL